MALFIIHYEIDFDVEEIVNRFAINPPPRLKQLFLAEKNNFVLVSLFFSYWLVILGYFSQTVIYYTISILFQSVKLFFIRYNFSK